MSTLDTLLTNGWLATSTGAGRTDRGLQWVLYEGMKAVYPALVLVRGERVVDRGEFVGEEGYGRFCFPMSD